MWNNKGNIKTELISSIFLLSFIAIFISFFITFKISEKRQVEIETYGLQRIFFDIDKANLRVTDQLQLFLPAGVYFGLYDAATKKLISGRDMLEKERIFVGAENTAVGKEILYPSIKVLRLFIRDISMPTL